VHCVILNSNIGISRLHQCRLRWGKKDSVTNRKKYDANRTQKMQIDLESKRKSKTLTLEEKGPPGLPGPRATAATVVRLRPAPPLDGVVAHRPEPPLTPGRWRRVRGLESKASSTAYSTAARSPYGECAHRRGSRGGAATLSFPDHPWPPLPLARLAALKEKKGKRESTGLRREGGCAPPTRRRRRCLLRPPSGRHRRRRGVQREGEESQMKLGFSGGAHRCCQVLIRRKRRTAVGSDPAARDRRRSNGLDFGPGGALARAIFPAQAQVTAWPRGEGRDERAAGLLGRISAHTVSIFYRFLFFQKHFQ